MILGLNGLPGVGKDTIAQRLPLFSRLPVEHRSFAAKLKQSAAALLGLTVEDLERFKRMENLKAVEVWEPGPALRIRTHLTMREFLQRYGTEAHRDIFGPDFWVDAVLPPGTEHSDKLVVITDVRFENEADRIRELGGEVWEVRGRATSESAHASDKELLPWHRPTIVNYNHEDEFASLDRQLIEALARLGLDQRAVTDDARAFSGRK